MEWIDIELNTGLARQMFPPLVQISRDHWAAYGLNWPVKGMGPLLALLTPKLEGRCLVTRRD
jgi:hypothetical protein